MKKLIKQFAVAVATGGLAVSVSAVPTLMLDDGAGNTATIAFGSAPVLTGSASTTLYDSSTDSGVVFWKGKLGNWTLSVTTGETKPFLGSAARPNMDLNTVDSSSTAGGTLIIKWSDDGFGPTVGNAFASIGGTSGGTVKYDTYADAGNAIFGTTTPLTTQSFGAGSFSGDAGGPDLAAQGSPYSLTQVITITHTGKATTSLNAVLTVPDGGMTLMLLGSGLTALSLLRRKFAIKA